MLKRTVKKVLYKLGYELKARPKQKVIQHNQEMLKGLLACKALPLEPMTIIDVGAAAGTWTMAAKTVWSESNFLLFEPLEERNKELKALSRKERNVDFVNAAAGREEAELLFVVTPDLDGSGVASSDSVDTNTRKVRVTRPDFEAEKRKLKGPYLVKLDTHGFEIPILEGCSGIMDDVILFIIECYGFQIADNSLLFWEMCQYMEKAGFRLFRIVDVMNRQKDGAFWQCDAFFIKKDHPTFLKQGYH